MNGGTPGEQLIVMARSGGGVFAQARALVTANPGDPHGRVRARRLVEATFADTELAPAAAGYHQAAVVLRGDGHATEAGVLTALARLEPELVAAETRWRERYGQPAIGPVSRELQIGGLDHRLGPACRGIDGALYQAGSTERGDRVVVVRAGAGMAVLDGWDKPAAAWSWIRGRLPGAEGPLDWPGGRSVPGPVLEERVLAFVLRAPWELNRAHQALRGYGWSACSREAVFASAQVTSWRGRVVDACSVTAEAAGRYAWLPAAACDELGGPDAPHLAVYIRRLARTPVTVEVARDAMSVLAARGALVQPIVRAHHRRTVLLPRPPPVPPGPGLVPRI